MFAKDILCSISIQILGSSPNKSDLDIIYAQIRCLTTLANSF